VAGRFVKKMRFGPWKCDGGGLGGIMVWRRDRDRIIDERNIGWIILIRVLGRGGSFDLPVRLRSYT